MLHWYIYILSLRWYINAPRKEINKSVNSSKFTMYRVIHKSLRDFRPLRYSSRDGHAEGEHVNIGRDTPVSVLPYRCSICWLLSAPDKRFSHMLESLGRWPRPPASFMYHSRIVLSVGGSVWYMVRNLRCTVTVDSVLANSKTQNAFLFTVHAIFRHDYPLAVEPASTPRPLVQKKKLWEILYLLICSFLPCLSWLLHSRVRKFRRDLWITLYFLLILRLHDLFSPERIKA